MQLYKHMTNNRDYTWPTNQRGLCVLRSSCAVDRHPSPLLAVCCKEVRLRAQNINMLMAEVGGGQTFIAQLEER